MLTFLPILNIFTTSSTQLRKQQLAGTFVLGALLSSCHILRVFREPLIHHSPCSSSPVPRHIPAFISALGTSPAYGLIDHCKRSTSMTSLRWSRASRIFWHAAVFRLQPIRFLNKIQKQENCKKRGHSGESKCEPIVVVCERHGCHGTHRSENSSQSC